jgi:dolichol-phosphate mannosyltransferase
MLTAVRAQLPQASIWVIDDNSPDGTGDVADAFARTDSQVQVFHRPGKLGLGTAYVWAFRRALEEGYETVFQMDSDFSHAPEYLPRLLETLNEADVVIGSRYTAGGGTRNWSRFRQLISRGGNAVARVGLGLTVRDATGGFRAYKRTTLERLRFEDLYLRGYGFQVEVVDQLERMGLRIKEIPIIFVERASGESKMSKDIVLEAALHVLRRRLQRMRGKNRPPDVRVSPSIEES